MLIVGCGEDFEKEVAYVSGTVTCGGTPVTEGYVLFTPIVAPGADAMKSGKSARGAINSDGTYIMGTYDDDDGAVLGEHEVRIYRPDPEDDESPEAMAYARDPFVCGKRVLTITVEDKNNVIDLDPAKG